MESGNGTPYAGLAEQTLFSAKDVNKEAVASRAAERSKEETRRREMAQSRAEEVRRLKAPVEITAEKIASFMNRVHLAARQGQKEILILRFPSDLCTDGGRAINNAQPAWEETLVGVPKQIYQVWLELLKPRGFALHAEVLDFPNGMPGDVGLFCRW
jgi:hypothetical protein